MADITIVADGARADVEANTEAGTAFIDSWIGGLLEVVDSGRIVIPREVDIEFRKVASQFGLTVEEES